MAAAALQGVADPIGSNSGLGVLPRDTTTDLEWVGFKLPTLQSLDNPALPSESPQMLMVLKVQCVNSGYIYTF